MTETHAYFFSHEPASSSSTSPVVLRARVDGSGTFESEWRIAPERGATKSLLLRDTDGQLLPALLLATGAFLFEPIAQPRLAIQPLSLRGNARRDVVEYYHSGIRRYFITGIPSEQAALDGNPSVGLVRTGMRFAASEAYVAEAGLNPVCRFYSPPSQGGSNSHFFAQGDTCHWARLWSNLRPEGFDFSVVPPNAGMCAASAPHAVRRLFNNLGATNQGNHRYVVSEASRQRMIARGWVDEGVVFCATGIVDATD